MRYRDYLKIKLASLIPEEVRLPKGYHVIGHVILLDLDRSAMDFAKQIAEATLQFESRGTTVVVKTGPTTGETRRPNYKYIAGNPETITVHAEAGVHYKIDPTQLTFSGGNRAERIRMPEIVKRDELVIDMFSCVGQFAIPIAKRSGANVIAIEINPMAVQYLKENIRINNVENLVIPVLGDCRQVTPPKVADRVIMGYLHDTIDYLPIALNALKQEGGWIHMHQTWPVTRPTKDLENAIRIVCDGNYQCACELRIVKEYAPNVEHLVADIRVVPI